MEPKIIESIRKASKPCYVTSEVLYSAVMDNLLFLANNPLDIVGPNRFYIGLKNLEQFIDCKIQYLPQDKSYIITQNN